MQLKIYKFFRSIESSCLRTKTLFAIFFLYICSLINISAQTIDSLNIPTKRILFHYMHPIKLKSSRNSNYKIIKTTSKLTKKDTPFKNNSDQITNFNTKVANSDWILVKAKNNSTEISFKNPNDFKIQFDIKTQTFRLQSDCNRIIAKFNLTKTSLNLENMGSTKKYCHPSDENKFIDLLLKLKNFELRKDDKLLLILTSPNSFILFNRVLP